MASWDDVARLALSLPSTSEKESRGLRQWLVRDKLFVWERPLRKADLAALGPEAPAGPILGARFGLEQAADALKLIDGRGATGKVVLDVAGG